MSQIFIFMIFMVPDVWWNNRLNLEEVGTRRSGGENPYELQQASTSLTVFVLDMWGSSHHGLFGVDLLRGRVGNLLDDGGDVGGTVELQLGEAGLVGLHHALDTWRDTKHRQQISDAAVPDDSELIVGRSLNTLKYPCLLMFIWWNYV